MILRVNDIAMCAFCYVTERHNLIERQHNQTDQICDSLFLRFAFILKLCMHLCAYVYICAHEHKYT